MLSVVIPMYNEKAAAPACIRQLTECLEAWAEASSDSYELLFSDDGSDDGCGDLVREFADSSAPKSGDVRILREERNRGKGAAVRRGMLAAQGEAVLFTDCDLAYGCRVIPELLDDLTKNGGDVLIGSRAIHENGYAGYSLPRKLASRLYVKLLSAAAGFSHTDSQCGLKLFRRDAAQAIFSRAETDGWAFDFEVLLLAEKLGFTVREVPVQVLSHRQSKIRLFRDSFRMMREVGRIRRRIGKAFPDHSA